MFLVVLGAGESGVGAAILGQKQGFKVFVSDKSAIAQKYKQELSDFKIEFEEEKHSEDIITKADVLVKSPGIPDTVPLILTLKEQGTAVISEIEFAAKYNQGKTICVTGSNGKTTTVNLIYHILFSAGVDVGLAGNVGVSFARMVALDPHDYYVLELSSFQLDGMYNFKADVAVICNITPDHLDRYDFNFENYIDSKFRILQNMTSSDVFIYNADDEVLVNRVNAMEIEPDVRTFSASGAADSHASLSNNIIKFIHEKTFNMKYDELGLPGKHNAYNSMAAALAANAFDIKNEVIRDSLSEFKGIEHRMEPVAKVRNIEFINDSKATNVNSSWFALESMKKQVVWIAGGKDKGNDYSDLKYLAKDKVKVLICIGVDNNKLFDAFEGVVPHIVEAQDMREAVNAAYYFAERDEVVLLSPACASFDRFKSYEDRGNQFKEIVRSL